MRLENDRISALSSLTSFQYLTRLVNDGSPRIAGTVVDQKSAQQAAEMFLESGFSPEIEWFPHPIWHTQESKLILSNGMTFPSISICFGNSGAVEGMVIPVGDPHRPEDLNGLDLSGKIALIDGRDIYFEYPDNPQTDMFLDAGVAGLIFVAGKNHLGGIPQAYYNYKRWYGGDTPPSVIITYADCQVLKSLRPVQAKIAVAGQVEWGKSANVYAEIRGARMPEETIVIGAHRDSTATSPGASDDAAGCALVLELARAFLQTGLPQRTLRFILYGGHETGLHGCENWLHRRVDQIQKIMACINFDVHGVLEGKDHASVLGSDQWVNLIRRCTKTIPRPLQIEIEPREVDMMAYASLGIPSVNFARYGIPRYHTYADGLQGTGPEGLESGLLFGGSLLADLADYQEPLNFGKFPWERLKASREFAERWGWGII